MKSLLVICVYIHIVYHPDFISFYSTEYFRVDKEKQQYKGEIEDLQAQIEHISKNRVNFFTC